MAHPAKQIALLTTLAAVVLFANLGAAQLWDEDEAIFAGAAREMLDRGDWVVPYFNGQMLPDKPALMYWLMIAGYQLFGPTEFAARCGSAAFGLASVLLTWQLGRRLFSAQVGFWAGVVLATSLNFDLVMRAATPDALLVFFSSLALYAFVSGTTPRTGNDGQPGAAAPPGPHGAPDHTNPKRKRGPSLNLPRLRFGLVWGAPFGVRGGTCAMPLSAAPRWSTYVAVYAAMGMAALAKGPVGIVLPTATIGLYLLISRLRPSETRRASTNATWTAKFRGSMRTVAAVFHPLHVLRTAWSMRPLTAVAVLLAVAGPWYVWVGVRTEGAWTAGFFGVHNLGRFLKPMEHHSGPFFYYPIAVLIGLFPWSVFLGPGVRQAIQRLRGDDRWRPAYLLVACWIAVYLVIFSAARTKLPNYILPMYPALALLVGAWIEAWLQRPSLASRRELIAAWSTLGLVGLAMAIVAPIVASKLLGGDPLLLACGLPLIGGAAAAWYFSRHAQPRRAAWSLTAAAVVWSLSLFGWAAPRVDRHQTSAQFAEVIHQRAAGQTPVIKAFGYYRPSLVYYTRQPVRQVFAPEDVETFFREHPSDGFLFTSDQHLQRLAGKLPDGIGVLDRRRWFLRSREIVLLGRGAPRVADRSPLTPKNGGPSRRK